MKDQLGNGGPDYFYRVEVIPVQPALELSVNEVVQYVQPNVVIPRGRKTAILVSAKRDNFGGPIEFAAENLPAGVNVESAPTWAADGTLPLLFSATEDAAQAGQYATVVGTWTHANGNTSASAKVNQNILRIRANNNQTFWQEEFDQIPVVVAEAVPFDIQVVTPQVPIVRGGQMNLKVIATREEGFDEPIQLLVLQNAPGVNSSRSIKIEKGQTEANLPLNASGNAPLRESHLVIRAIAKVGNANVEICTDYVPITVAEKYMNLKYVNVAVEQGQEIEYPVEIENLTEFEGTATVELVGLPTKTKTEPQEITKETKQIVFPITTEADAPIGETKNMFCKIIVTQNGEPILHNIGEGRLRINKPAPAPVTPKPAAPEPQAKKEEQPKPKVLSRLEALRVQQEQLREQLGN